MLGFKWFLKTKTQNLHTFMALTCCGTSDPFLFYSAMFSDIILSVYFKLQVIIMNYLCNNFYTYFVILLWKGRPFVSWIPGCFIILSYILTIFSSYFSVCPIYENYCKHKHTWTHTHNFHCPIPIPSALFSILSSRSLSTSFTLVSENFGFVL